MKNKLPYDPQELPRELQKYYISASDDDINQMLSYIGKSSLSDLFDHIPNDLKFKNELPLPKAMEYFDIKDHLESISEKNNNGISFLGNGLPSYAIPPIVGELLQLRELTTSYTPYQPERSQGTLETQWLYQCALSMLTGFEAINASLYDRSTAMYESILCAKRLAKNKNRILVSGTLHPSDLKVLETLSKETDLIITVLQTNKDDAGLLNPQKVKELLETYSKDSCGIVFPQVNCYGLLEDVDSLTDLGHEYGLKVVAQIDPLLLGTKGLKPPSDYGQKGADLIFGEGMHTSLSPTFGGLGLGIFGIRYNENDKISVRATAGRFVGKGVDIQGRACKVMVLSTREQHIRREKANSNICSNQAYLATLAGASFLARGEKGLTEAFTKGHENISTIANFMLTLENVHLTFPNSSFSNEILVTLPVSVSALIAEAKTKGIDIGINISEQFEDHKDNQLLICCTDKTTSSDLDAFFAFFKSKFKTTNTNKNGFEIPKKLLRAVPLNFPSFSHTELLNFYLKLAGQNISPDEGCYPLGSCTMKYNPYINDYTAGLEGFAFSHPNMRTEDIQGSLEIIYQTQEYFKAITGLPAVTTQPVAGAQGELVGLKLFQAYFHSKKEKRDIILIPKTAHGTNPATATVAGYYSLSSSSDSGIITIGATPEGEINIADIQAALDTFGSRIAGIMITNPNTSGIFETRFKEISDLLHKNDSLVYMDGANMNAIAGWVDLNRMGVDAVHNNTHKTWSIPHGGGGPGDAFVAVSEKLVNFLPGIQVIKSSTGFQIQFPKNSIGSFHRHHGNFAHKIRCYTYLCALGSDGIKKMSAVAVLSAKYLYKKLSSHFQFLPLDCETVPRMHEFIITLKEEELEHIATFGIPRNTIISRIGKLFLDFGFHSPTVSFPETLGLMIEPTESYTKAELDRFADAVIAIYELTKEHPEVLKTVPHFTPIDRVDEVSANKNLVLSEPLKALPTVLKNRLAPADLYKLSIEEIKEKILETHRSLSIG